MSKWTNLLLDVNYMKDYAKNAAKVVTIDISRFGMTDEQIIKDAAEARYQLDQLLLDEWSRIEKWAQYMVHDFDSASVVFRGTRQECEDWIVEHEMTYPHCELYWALPDDQHFSWNRYFREVENRCGIEIEFMF